VREASHVVAVSRSVWVQAIGEQRLQHLNLLACHCVVQWVAAGRRWSMAMNVYRLAMKLDASPAQAARMNAG